jgi:DNA-binding PadR family transcriptional regulator
MSIRHSLLILLSHGESYGYRLRSEFEQRTGGTWPLNIGQVYTTLDRLERDGRVVRGGEDDRGHVLWTITAEGHLEAEGWISSPVVRDSRSRDELAVKFALAASLPGIDVSAMVQTQRTSTLRHLQDLTRSKTTGIPDGEGELAWSLVIEGLIFQAEAEVRWLDHVEATLLRARASAPAPTPAVPAREVTR